MTPRDLAPIDISLEGIGHILRDRRLDVPAYQRGYAWEESEVSDFWWDLRAAFGSQGSQYFLGTIVLTTEPDGRTTIYLFGLSRNDIDTIQEQWTGALSSLQASADEETFTTFVRHLWGSLRGSTRERELYGQIKAEITSAPSALRFGQQLESAAPFYAALLSADHPYWADKTELAPAAQTLLRLGLEQNRPLLLAAMRRFDDSELAVLIRAVISWSVRGLVVGGIGGGTTERAYGEPAVRVSEGSAVSTADVYEELSGVIAADEEFRRVFAGRRINRSRLAKYLLAALTQAEAGVGSPSIVSETTDSRLVLGTVMPRSAAPEEWPDFPHDDRACGWPLASATGRLALLARRNAWTSEPREVRERLPSLASKRAHGPRAIACPDARSQTLRRSVQPGSRRRRRRGRAHHAMRRICSPEDRTWTGDPDYHMLASTFSDELGTQSGANSKSLVETLGYVCGLLSVTMVADVNRLARRDSLTGLENTLAWYERLAEAAEGTEPYVSRDSRSGRLESHKRHH